MWRRACLAVLVTIALGACSGGSSGGAGGGAGADAGPPARSCAITIWHHPASAAAQVEIVASWDGWARPGRLLAADRADGWRVTEVEAPPGNAEYAIVEDGVWIADPRVPTSAFHDGHEVAVVEVPDCDAPAVRVDAAAGSADGAATVDATFLTARGGPRLDAASVRVKEAPDAKIDAASPDTGKVHISLAGLATGKHRLEIDAADASGRAAEPALATVWIEPRPFDPRDGIVYQVIVDRYRGDDDAPLAPPKVPSDRAGGTLRGLRAAIERGDVSALGANVLWVSPLYANPTGTFPGADGRPYSSYHGYWPVQPRAVEPLLGSEADVDALVAAAHARGIRVLFDVVPNHVHEQHPYASRHKDPWCVCGAPGCDWGAHVLDCWFAPYLPDLDWTRDDVAADVTSDVVWWVDRFDADGVRIDAVPMMPRAATRRIAYALRSRFDHDGNRTILLGENFTGPGGFDLLRYQLGPFGLDGEFHFPLMWALRAAIAQEAAPMSDVDAAVAAGERAWAGSGAVMGLMIGNHDVPRFASVASRDDGGDGWLPAPQPDDPRVYAKQRLALGVVFALPGMPVVYYGDELALAGRGDPDSRRPMPADAFLTDAMRSVRASEEAYARARSCAEPLRRGAYRSLYADPERLVFARELPTGERVVVVALREPAGPIEAPLPGIEAADDYVDLLDGTKASLRPELTKIDGAPFSVHLYARQGSSPCAPTTK